MTDTKTLDAGAKMRELERRIAQLESAGRVYGPIVASPVTLPPAGWPTMGESRCGKCGIHLSPVMGYSCAQSGCPSGLGGVSCTVTGGVPVGDGATLAKVFGHGGPFGEDGALLAVGYAENQ